MIIWQRWTRWALAAGAIGLAAVVATQFRSRTPVEPRPVERTDPKATVESTNGRSVRINLEHEEVRIEYEKLLGYDDGSTRMLNVRVVTQRAQGRTFTMTAKEGRAGQHELDLSLIGDVHLQVSDGLQVSTDAATYTDGDGTVRAPGAVEYSRGRMNGSGVGMTYVKNTDVLTILDHAIVHFVPGDESADRIDITAGNAQFDRPASTVRLERRMRLVKVAEITEADVAFGRLSDDEQEIKSLELRGRSSITAAAGGAGAFRSLAGRDIDITYAPDGRTIERTSVREDAAISLAGGPGRPGREITARTVDIALAPDGVTPTNLVAREAVRLTLPPENDTATRTVRADLMEAQGRAPEGLTSAHFSGHVEFDERGPDVTRTARSQILDASMEGGLGTIEEANFSRGVRFDDTTMSASASAARYVPGKGILELKGNEPGFVAPHLRNDRLDLGATRIDVLLEGPRITATGKVGSTLRPQQAPAAGGRAAGPDRKAPSMLKSDQDVQVTADRLAYDGKASNAVYTGNALLWQAATKIRGASITIDDATGNLTAEGGVATTTMVLQEGKDGEQVPALSAATARDLHYDESLRRATYTGNAHLTDPQGDLHASTIAVYLKPSGDEIERIEGHEHVQITLLETRRVATGDDLTYFSADERYVVHGAPVTILDECGRRNEGLTLTFFRAVDRIILVGGPQNLTQTRSDGASCR